MSDDTIPPPTDPAHGLDPDEAERLREVADGLADLEAALAPEPAEVVEALDGGAEPAEVVEALPRRDLKTAAHRAMIERRRGAR